VAFNITILLDIVFIEVKQDIIGLMFTSDVICS